VRKARAAAQCDRGEAGARTLPSSPSGFGLGRIQRDPPEGARENQGSQRLIQAVSVDDYTNRSVGLSWFRVPWIGMEPTLSWFVDCSFATRRAGIPQAC
jgi:hypothetical protein